jgi:predicted kinase
MQLIIFTGIQGSGKSTFYKEKFFHTHMRINLDQLRTRHRESRFVETCFETGTPFVVDNTNTLPQDRKRYITQAKITGYEIIGYFFDTVLEEALGRNKQRYGRMVVPEKAIVAAYKKLIPPSYYEGFDIIYKVKITKDAVFKVCKM